MSSEVYFIDFKTSFRRNIFDKLQTAVENSHFYDFIEMHDKIAIKLHFGEYGNFSAISPRYVRFFVDRLKEVGGMPFITDTNTLYAGQRGNSVDHLNLAILHGFTPGVVNAPIIIADGLWGQNEVPVEINTPYTKTAYIASEIYHCEALLALSHFKGHVETVFGGALKNIGMGCASRKGKMSMHSVSIPKVNSQKCTGCKRCVEWCAANAITIVNKKAIINKDKCTGCSQCISVCPFHAIGIRWDAGARHLTKRITDYAFAICSLKKEKIFFVTFLNNITELCDCAPIHGKRLVPDIGILFSKDIVAIEQASLDLVNEAAGKDLFGSLHPVVNWQEQILYAEELGLGTKEYKLKKLS